MRFGGHQKRQRRTPFWALLAFVGVLAQAVLPAAAMAAASVDNRQIVICSDEGVQSVVVDRHGDIKKPGFAGLPCQDCLSVSLAIIVTPELTVAPTAYAAHVVRHVEQARRTLVAARPPPRPPGQGPPALNV